jgi:ABC-type branched-subunit amino acid transport system ATPase component
MSSDIKSSTQKKKEEQGMMLHHVSNMMKLDDFSLESLSQESTKQSKEYKTIRRFLNMKVVSRGGNIPWNMRKLIILAKAFVQEPYLLFLDEAAVDLGNSPTNSSRLQRQHHEVHEENKVQFFELDDCQFFAHFELCERIRRNCDHGRWQNSRNGESRGPCPRLQGKISMLRVVGVDSKNENGE